MEELEALSKRMHVKFDKSISTVKIRHHQCQRKGPNLAALSVQTSKSDTIFLVQNFASFFQNWRSDI